MLNIRQSAFYGIEMDATSADRMSLEFSRAVSFILLGIYFLYLLFQFKSHPELFWPTRQPVSKPENVIVASTTGRMSADLESQPARFETPSRDLYQPEMQQLELPTDPQTSPVCIQPESALPLIQIEPSQRAERTPRAHNQAPKHNPRCGCEYYTVLANRALSCALLIMSTTLIAICAEYFASSFAVLNEQGILGESFVGLIIIPIAGNVAENVTAVVVAAKGQMDLAISVALGSAIQIGLLVSPLLVLVGWALDKPMNLHFDRFEVVALVGAVLLVNFIVLKGKTNYLEGSILCACFAAVSYVTPF
jgi:Ca2+:H+ antiporter